MHGQVYGEYRSQRRKSYGQAFDGFAPGLGRLHSTTGVDGTEFIICLLFILSGFYRNIYIGTVSGTSVIFHVDGRGLMYSYVLFFPAVIFFLHLVCERQDFQFCLLSSSSWVFVALAVGSVGFWLALSFAFYPPPPRRRPSIALRDRLLSQIPRSGRQWFCLCFCFLGFFFLLFFIHVHVCKSLYFA